MKTLLRSWKSCVLTVCLTATLALAPSRGEAQDKDAGAAAHWRNTPANTWFLMSMDVGRLIRIFEASPDLREVMAQQNPNDPVARMWAMGKLGLVWPFPMVFGASAGPEGEGPKTLEANSPLKAFIHAPPDFGMYFDMGNFPKEILAEAIKQQGPSKSQQVLIQKIIGMAPPISASMRFEKGTVTIDTTAYDKEMPANLEGKGLPAGLLDVVSANSIAAFKVCLNKKAVSEHVKARWKLLRDVVEKIAEEEAGLDFTELEAIIEAGVQESTGLTPENLLAIPKGDMVMAITGIAQGEFGEPMPSFVIGLSIADNKKLDQLLEKFEDQGLMEMIDGFGVKLVRKDDLLFFCSADQEKVVRHGRAARPLAGTRRKLLDSNGVAGFLGFDQIAKLAQQFDAPKEVRNVIATLEDIRFTGSLKKDKQAYKISLNFKNKKTNGLQQLLEIMARNNPRSFDQRQPDDDIGFPGRDQLQLR